MQPLEKKAILMVMMIAANTYIEDLNATSFSGNFHITFHFFFLHFFPF